MQQKLVPGVVGISTYVDFAYHRAMQIEACRIAGTSGPINQLRTITVALDFSLLLANLRDGRRGAAQAQVTEAIRTLAAAGASFVVVTSGTTSTLTGPAREETALPFLDLADAAWHEARAGAPVGLLATGYAVAGGLFQAAAARHGGKLVLPSAATAKRVDCVIFDELVCGRVTDDVVTTLTDAVRELAQLGAGSVILGNTDMSLATDKLAPGSPVPLVDASLAHARAAARAALSGVL
jgi:aspartate racemase